MSYFTLDQDKVLHEILTEIVNEGKDKEKIAKIKTYGLLDAINKLSYIKSVVEDVQPIADDNGISLTSEQLEEIAHIVISEYDYSDYNEYIADKINEHIAEQKKNRNHK